jgi:peptidyl-dipeptidase A
MLNLALLVARLGTALADAGAMSPAQAEAQRFLDVYNSLYTSLNTVDSESNWAAGTDVNDANSGRRTASGQLMAAFYGDPAVLAEAKAWLARKSELTPLQVKQFEYVLFNAGASPGSIPDVVNARIALEAKEANILDSWVFCLVGRNADGSCPEPKVANDIAELLVESRDLAERRTAWEASKEVGKALKPGLAELIPLRNRVAREMGYSSFFGYMVAEYGMTVPEMMGLLDGLVTDMQPLFSAVHTWAGHQYAKRYGQPAPGATMPAHWIGNRWAQDWPALVEAGNLDPYFAGRTPEWIVKSSETFYTSIGFPALPPSFYEKSDLYPVPPGQSRKKNAHASAWHVDLRKDVRSLMSVVPDANWFFTSHHELGHVYYYISYTRPEVPPVLRGGANRGFHEGIGELISIAAGQTPYLKSIGVLPKNTRVDPMQHMLVEALEQTVAFVPFAAGTMSNFEHDLYERNLPPEQWQARWWELVTKYQGVVPPDPARIQDKDLCDACTKTHIIDDPAGYYDYAIATVLKYQLHEHIARKILKQDPHACNYAGNKQVGDFLRGIMEQGATRDWRVVLKEATGEDLSTRAMVAYFAPLKAWLDKENRKAAKGR